MKTKIFIFSSLLCLCGTFNAGASECVGAGCDIEPIQFEEFEWVHEQGVTEPMADMVAEPVWDMDVPVVVPEQDIKVLTIKPVPEDTRPELWDGVHGEYAGATSDKTVDWQTGIPIWDDSINSYKYKDFSDWFLEPTPEVYLRETVVDTTPMKMFNDNMSDVMETRARVEELLAPRKPDASLWFTNMPKMPQPVAETVVISEEVFVANDGCPFETETECEIWRRKPIVHETVSPRSPKLRGANVDAFVDAARCDKHITANEGVSAPLLARYKLLMKSAQACCTDGMAYELKQAGASDGLIYKFLADDANFYGFGARCLMMTDHDLDTQYPNTATAVVAADVRNGCLCRGREWFTAMLAPFEQVYSQMPEFRDALFNYTYTDGLGRQITVSVNNDVQNVLKQLSQCP